ncbi:DUF4249 domain-containing protein [Flavobacterium terrigena]|uniref:DUF4249 domain-containing protein n=1 Tax=Flavobacterium terrigena TaxID=402734 RepID=A0A1H6QT83_9FLAO|nr:DUF4249 domain-containing protein [Flavobacterium terrigena]SEI46911.1 protein of unknown function [Flavobacterium terrigena]
MKTIIKYFILVISFAFISCEEVVDVDLNKSEPKLVIDASIKWEKGTIGNEQTIRLTTTGDYFNNTVPVANGAIVTITDSSNTIFNFIEDGLTGYYKCTNFNPVLNEVYTLSVAYKGQTYTSTDKLYSVPTITTIEQDLNGITGNEIELKFNFQDNGTEENYYMEEYKVPFRPFPLLGVFNDEFTNGNEMFSLIIDEDLEAGQNINFTLHGISKRYHNYMNILIGISGGLSNGPFSTPAATVKGNIINQTNRSNYPLGYFRLSEVDVRNYVIQ